MRLLPNDRRLIQPEKLYYLLDQIDEKLRIDEQAEEILIEFANEYVENLMEFAMDMDERQKEYEKRKTGEPVQQQTQGSQQRKEKFSDVGFLELAREIIGKRGLKHADVKRDLYAGERKPTNDGEHDEESTEE